MKRVSDALGCGLYAALLFVSAAFLILPIIVSIVLSFDARSFIGSFPPTEFSLRWYKEFFYESYYHEGLKTSLIVASIATLVSSLLGTLAAISIDRGQFRGRSLIETFLLSPLVIPTVVVGFGVLIFSSRLGILDAMSRLIMGHILITLPYVLRTVLAVLQGVPRSYIEAALSLGARPWAATLFVTIPLARSGIVAGAIFSFVISFDEVAVSLFLSDAFTYTLPVALLAQMRADLNLTIAAVSVIFLIAVTILILALDRLAGIKTLTGENAHGR